MRGMFHPCERGAMSAVFAVAVLFAAMHGPAARGGPGGEYRLIDLGGDEFGLVASSARDVSNSGFVVGELHTAAGARAFRWSLGAGMMLLAPGPFGTPGPAEGVNELGQSAGYSVDAANGDHALLWDEFGGVHDVGNLGGMPRFARGYGINNDGVIVGESRAPGGTHAFVWLPSSGMRDLGALPGGESRSAASAVNNRGDAAGHSDSSDGEQAVFWPMGQPALPLGDLAGGPFGSRALGLNELGQIVGKGTTAGGPRAFLWDAANGMRDLGVAHAGDSQSFADDVNASGLVVGQSIGDAAVAVLWTEARGMVDLNTLVDESAAGWRLLAATAVNDDGWIVGYGLANEGSERAFLLVPIPEPAGGVGVLICLGLMIRARLAGRPGGGQNPMHGARRTSRKS